MSKKQNRKSQQIKMKKAEKRNRINKARQHVKSQAINERNNAIEMRHREILEAYKEILIQQFEQSQLGK